MRTPIASVVVGLIAIGPPLAAYLTSLDSYDGLAKSADMVVIAVPTERRELPDAVALPGVRRGDQPIPAVALRTTFHVVTVLAGSGLAADDAFELHHFREKDPPQGFREMGPMLIDFDPRQPHHYLMFLRLRPDAAYEAVNPVEPGWCIEKLAHPVDRPAS